MPPKPSHSAPALIGINHPRKSKTFAERMSACTAACGALKHLLVVGVSLPWLHEHDHHAAEQAPKPVRSCHCVHDFADDVVVRQLRVNLEQKI